MPNKVMKAPPPGRPGGLTHTPDQRPLNRGFFISPNTRQRHMSLIVQKYGGSSVATLERMQALALRIRARIAHGDSLVVVVSAMGDATDDLLARALAAHSEPDDREVDLLLSTGEVVSCALMSLTLKAAGVKACALTGAQAGIITDGAFSRAVISSFVPGRIRAALAEGLVPVVAGYQGATSAEHSAEVTTLGRGGSDTSAVALAVGLGADWCEIYTDVDGVYTADPRIVPDARQLSRIGPLEMLELAQHGARVMHPRAVELGGANSMPILVRSSFHEGAGTWIIEPEENVPGDRYEEEKMELRPRVSGVVHDTGIAKLSVHGLPRPEFALFQLFEPLARAGVNVDAIAQSSDRGGARGDCAFTVPEADLTRTLRIIEATAADLGAEAVSHERAVGKVSVVGLGVQHSPGLAALVFSTLGAAEIPIDMVTTSQVRISCLVPEDRTLEATRLLHHAFGLDRLQSEVSESTAPAAELLGAGAFQQAFMVLPPTLVLPDDRR
jgi:aspartate kinase